MNASRLLVTFVPDRIALKAIVAGMSTLERARLVIDRIAAEATATGAKRVLISVRWVDSDLDAHDYALMAQYASMTLGAFKCAIVAPPGRTAGEEQVPLLSGNFRIFRSEDKALGWLESEPTVH